MIHMSKRLRAAAALLLLCTTASAARADDAPYTDGPVVNVGYIRTEYGKFDEYVAFLAGPWKQEQEALKKAGLIVSYSVLTVEPRNESDPDIILVTRYPNWATFDGLRDKSEAIMKSVYGTKEQANAGASDRGKIRRVLGGQTMQELVLK